MIRPFISCFVAASLWVPALASGQASPTQPAPAAPPNANLVVVDVVVTDAQHNPVHKLTASDFTLLENGHPQTITTMEEHNSWESAAPMPRPPKLSPGIFTNFSIAPTSGAINVLLLDALNTPADIQAAVREQMVAYLKDVRPGARMAIVALTNKLVMLQGLTSDPELLGDVLNGEKDRQKTSLAETDIVNAGMPDPNDSATNVTGAGLGNTPSVPEVFAGLRQFQTVTEPVSSEVQAQTTLDALNLLGHYLRKFPGRKNLIWISGSFPINVLPDGSLENPFAALPFAADEFRETTDLLSRCQVAVYPIEAHISVSETAPSWDANDNSKPLQKTGNTHETMKAIAQASGGESSPDTGGISAAVEKAIEAGSHYYTITYSPTDQRWTGDYRKIRIDTAQQGLTLAYRRGYFADDPGAPIRHGQPQVTDKVQASFSTMPAAMVRGGPDLTDILFTATVQPTAADPEPVVASGNKVNENLKGPFRRYAARLGIDLHDLTCPTNAAGVYECRLEVAANVYNANGTLLNSAGGVIVANIPADHFAAVLRSGLRFRQEISVPVDGYSFLRIGVHEQATNKIGTVELPVASVSNLPPLESTALTRRT